MIRRIVLSTLSGILSGFSWHSFGFPLFIFFFFVPLFLLEEDISVNEYRKKEIKIFLYSSWGFLIWNLIVIHWLGFAKRINGSYAIEALLFPVLINSLLMGIIFTIYHWVKKYIENYLGLLFFIFLWISFEKVHLSWEITFPWLNLGNVFAKYHEWIQWYEYTGTFGGSLWILLVNVFIFYQYQEYKANKKHINVQKSFFLLLIFICAPIIISYYRYHNFIEQGNKIKTIILQPKLDPYHEKYIFSGVKIVNTLLELSNKKISKDVNFIVAPETAFPGYERIEITSIEENNYINLIKNYLSSKNKSCIFISGVNTYKIHPNKQNQTESIFWNPNSNSYEENFNSAIQITTCDSVLIYHKSKLVAGVEKMPFSIQINRILKQLFNGFSEISFSLGTQDNRSVFKNSFNHAIIAPIICYESIYGEYVGTYIKKGANLLLVMTNDSWWGDSEGHKQLLMLTKLRAIETRKNILRSANSGISCTIDAKGNINNSLSYSKQGVIKTKTFINNYKTPYVIYGDVIARICFLFLGIIFFYAVTQIFFNKKNNL